MIAIIRTKIVHWRKRLVLFYAFMGIIGSPDLHAREMSEQEVRIAVENWVRYVPAEARKDAKVAKLDPYQIGGKTVGYIVHLQGGGYCLAGNDDLVLPVYLYSPKGNFDLKSPQHQYFLTEIAQHVKYLRAEHELRRLSTATMKALDNRALRWKSLLKEKSSIIRQQFGVVPKSVEPTVRRFTAIVPQEVEPVSMQLNLTSQWNQGPPYNNDTPFHPQANQHTLVGCNGTALAQIMYYWKWPPKGGGNVGVNYDHWNCSLPNWLQEPLSIIPNIPNTSWTNRLEWSAINGGTLQMCGAWDNSWFSAAQDNSISPDPKYQAAISNLWRRMTKSSTYRTVSFGNYDWSLMKDTYDPSKPPDPMGEAEVAKLSFHAGARPCSETACETAYGLLGTSGSLQFAKLDEYFGYDRDIKWLDKKQEAMVEYLTEEIKWLRPVALGGAGTGGGHAYVVYGYDKSTDPDRLFLMNMGWGPNDAHVWSSLDSTPFPQSQDHLIYIAPAQMVKFVGSPSAGDGSPANPYRDIESALADAPDGATLIFKAGTSHQFSGSSLVIKRPLTLKGYDVRITASAQ